MSEFPRTYKEAGVDIEFLDRLKRYGQEISKLTKTPCVLERNGSFLIDGQKIAQQFSNPEWKVETDGIGTKEDYLLLHKRCHTAGWDLVAANVNDIVRHGAIPLGMTVNITFQGLGEEEFKEFMNGIKGGLIEAGCALLGGETAIHPNLVPQGGRKWHLSGTAIGVVEKDKIITGEATREGDAILGLGSSGPHTNGYSLAMRVFEGFIPMEVRLINLLLAPSRIYVKPILSLLKAGIEVHGLIHVTGGGLTGRIKGCMPQGLCAIVDRVNWQKPPIFEFIKEFARIDKEEMYRTFNMGIGFVIILPPSQLKKAKEILGKTESVFEIGYIGTNPDYRLIYKTSPKI